MKTLKFLFAITICLFLVSCETKKQKEAISFPNRFKVSAGEETATYQKVVDFHNQLAKEFSEINVQTIGATDSAYPLHVVSLNSDGDFNFNKLIKTKSIVLINNGIHPGESDGIDATLMLYRDSAVGKINPPKNTVLVAIPFNNIGGALIRNSTSRANQNGPKSSGFRGNTRNYDLKRLYKSGYQKMHNLFLKYFIL